MPSGASKEAERVGSGMAGHRILLGRYPYITAGFRNLHPSET